MYWNKSCPFASFQRHLFYIGFCHAIFVAAALNIMIVIDHNNNNRVRIVIIIPITLIDIGSMSRQWWKSTIVKQSVIHINTRSIMIGFITRTTFNLSCNLSEHQIKKMNIEAIAAFACLFVHCFTYWLFSRLVGWLVD